MRAGIEQRNSVRVVVLTVLLLAATVLGAWRAASTSSNHPAPRTLPLGGTSLVVTHVERVTGLTDDDLGGMSHGIQGLVPDDETMLRVSFVLTAGSTDTAYDPADLRLGTSASTRTIRPVGGALGHGTLSARASITGAVSFVVPRRGARFVLRSVGARGSVPLGAVDQAPPGSGHSGMTHDTDLPSQR